MKPPLRTKSIGAKVGEAEFALLEERARGAGLRLAEWVREALLSAHDRSIDRVLYLAGGDGLGK